MNRQSNTYWNDRPLRNDNSDWDYHISDIDHINTKIDSWDAKPAPCSGCAFANRCAVQNIACVDFFHYVNLRDDAPLVKVRVPSRKWYERSYRMGYGEKNQTADYEASRDAVISDTGDGDSFGSEW